MADDVNRMMAADKDEWLTPEWLLEGIRENHGEIHTDPAASINTEIGSVNNYRLLDDGTEQDWSGTVFTNPPFSMKNEFLEKAVAESQKKEVDTIFFITPDGTNVQSWWHSYIAEYSDYVWFSDGRINYVESDGTINGQVTFGTAISVFGETTEDMIDWFQENGHLLKTVKT